MTKFTLATQNPIAANSADHLEPRGTKQDNSRNPLFNKKLKALFGHELLYILDFGCAGGAFVRDCIEEEHVAIGLEGSDYSQNSGRAEWANIPEHLFTCDITAEFEILDAHTTSEEEANIKFDVITAWEFMEHIHSNDLPTVCANAIKHLKEGGLWIMSVADFDEIVGETNYHLTVKAKNWWENFFGSMGFTNHPELVDYFGNDWVRGPLQGSPSFHLVLTYGSSEPPVVPSEIPYTGLDLYKTGVLSIEETIAEGEFSSLTLEYALLLLDEAENSLGLFEDLNYQRARALIHLGYFEEAEAAASLEIELHPGHEAVKRILAQLEDFTETKFVNGFDEFLIRKNRGVLMRERGEFDASLTEFERAIELQSDDEIVSQHLRETLKAMANQAIEQSEWNEGVAFLERFPETYANDPEWHFMTAHALHRQGQNLERACTQYNLAQEFGYEEFGLRLHRGILHREMGDLDASHTDLERALELRPDDDVAQHLQKTIEFTKLQVADENEGQNLDSRGNCESSPKKPQQLKISIVTPVYNCVDLIRTCIESVLAQEYDNFEHIIVDGASTDGTVEILQQYPHLKWISEPDGGESEALNKALQMVSGDVIGWLNADDCYVEGAFHKIAEVMLNDPQTQLIYGKTLFIDEHDLPTNWVIPYAPLNLVTLARWFKLNLFQPSIFFSFELLHDVGLFREDLEYGVDYEYWFRIASKGYTFHFIDNVLSKAMIYRSGGKTETPYTVKAQEWLQICKSYLIHLSTGEQTHFWKDYYVFRIQTHNSDFYFNQAPIDLPDTSTGITGFMLAIKELSLIQGELVNSVIQNPIPDTANLLGILGEHLYQNKRVEESQKAFEWALALESRNPAVLHRFRNTSQLKSIR